MIGCVQLCADVDDDNDVGAHGTSHVDRKIVGDATIHQQSVAEHSRRENSGDGHAA
jgi:hypothetical protein